MQYLGFLSKSCFERPEVTLLIKVYSIFVATKMFLVGSKVHPLLFAKEKEKWKTIKIEIINESFANFSKPRFVPSG